MREVTAAKQMARNSDRRRGAIRFLLGADRDTSDLVSTSVRQVDRQRDLSISCDVLGLRRCRGAAEIDGGSVIDIADCRRLRITVLTDSRNRHIVSRC